MSLSFLSGGSYPYISNSLLSNYPFTIAFFLKCTAQATGSPYLDYNPDTIQSTNYVRLIPSQYGDTTVTNLDDSLGSTRVQNYGPSGQITTNSWIPVVMRCDTTTTRKDTSLQSDTNDTTNKGTWGTANSTSEMAFFNTAAGGNAGTYGKIAYLAIYDGYLLSDAEVAQWTGAATDPSTISSGNMTNYWSDPGANQTDSIGSVVLTLNGATYDSGDNPSLGGSSGFLNRNYWWDNY